MSKRTLDSFFKSPNKKSKIDHTPPDTTSLGDDDGISGRTVQGKDDGQIENSASQILTYQSHSTYPFPICDLPVSISEPVEDLLITASSKVINNQPHLDLLYFQPLIPQPTATDLFHHLRSSLPFYRVKYTITKFGKPVEINTPRYTTVFGVDDTSRFVTISSTSSDANTRRIETKIVETSNPSKQVASAKYSCTPRPIPAPLSLLLNLTEAITGDKFNFCLVNYYATGNDSITYHSDDERFLGLNPSIASFTLGATRDFLMKHKPASKGKTDVESTLLKFNLRSGDMLLMRGETQSNWLHSIPKRKGGDADNGRINITLRRAMVPGGTENYYRYNVGDGEAFQWSDKAKAMLPVEMSNAKPMLKPAS